MRRLHPHSSPHVSHPGGRQLLLPVPQDLYQHANNGVRSFGTRVVDRCFRWFLGRQKHTHWCYWDGRAWAVCLALGRHYYFFDVREERKRAEKFHSWDLGMALCLSNRQRDSDCTALPLVTTYVCLVAQCATAHEQNRSYWALESAQVLGQKGVVDDYRRFGH